VRENLQHRAEAANGRRRIAAAKPRALPVASLTKPAEEGIPGGRQKTAKEPVLAKGGRARATKSMSRGRRGGGGRLR
ncbi:MAG TPA: hypothetical protein VFP10_06760, partial [Candidatus Eisenbacteria bacterium]|nr:hypothetical protein [Candidatus Eisenbacteria bacterium]